MRNTTRIIAAILISLGLIGCGHGKNSNKEKEDIEFPADTLSTVQPNQKSADGVLIDTIKVFRYWAELDDEMYLFTPPTSEQIALWKMECETRNKYDSPHDVEVSDHYADMNQYVTIYDFIELWYDKESYKDSLDFTLWRLAQYEGECNHYPDSEYDRFYYLKNSFQNLCAFDAQFQFEFNLWAGLVADFQEFYDKVMVREAIRHSSPRVAKALEREEVAWQNYHAELDSTFRIIDGNPDGLVGSAWGMAISGIAEDNARMREESLSDFYFALTDSLDYEVKHTRSQISSYEIIRNSKMPQNKVLREYRHFMDSFEEDECYYPIAEREKALSREMAAWKKWMHSRAAVSSLLTGICKDTYDNSTNNVRRWKYIMLKNRYAGYGIISTDIEECLMPYSTPDDQLDGPSFDERWKTL